MSLKFFLHSLILSLFMIMLLSCGGLFDWEDPFPTTIYYTSFENEMDLKGWNGISLENLQNDPAPGGGKKSVLISGGCLVPHASFTLNAPGKDVNVSISCFGKNLSLGGSVELHVGCDYSGGTFIQIADSVWTFYTSKEPLFWPKDSTLTIWLNSGGIVASAMLIDNLKIYQDNKSHANYFPLKVGNTWVYTSGFNQENEVTYKINSAVLINRKMYYTWGTTNSAYLDTIRIDKYGRIWKLNLNKEYLWLDFTLDDGAEYSYNPYNDNYDYTVKVSIRDSVKTYAGTFYDCRDLFFDILEAVDDEVAYIFADGVGIVQIYGAWQYLVLKSYTLM